MGMLDFVMSKMTFIIAVAILAVLVGTVADYFDKSIIRDQAREIVEDFSNKLEEVTANDLETDAYRLPASLRGIFSISSYTIDFYGEHEARITPSSSRYKNLIEKTAPPHNYISRTGKSTYSGGALLAFEDVYGILLVDDEPLDDPRVMMTVIQGDGSFRLDDAELAMELAQPIQHYSVDLESLYDATSRIWEQWIPLEWGSEPEAPEYLVVAGSPAVNLLWDQRYSHEALATYKLEAPTIRYNFDRSGQMLEFGASMEGNDWFIQKLADPYMNCQVILVGAKDVLGVLNAGRFLVQHLRTILETDYFGISRQAIPLGSKGATVLDVWVNQLSPPICCPSDVKLSFGVLVSHTFLGGSDLRVSLVDLDTGANLGSQEVFVIGTGTKIMVISLAMERGGSRRVAATVEYKDPAGRLEWIHSPSGWFESFELEVLPFPPHARDVAT